MLFIGYLVWWVDLVELNRCFRPSELSRSLCLLLVIFRNTVIRQNSVVTIDSRRSSPSRWVQSDGCKSRAYRISWVHVFIPLLHSFYECFTCLQPSTTKWLDGMRFLFCLFADFSCAVDWPIPTLHWCLSCFFHSIPIIYSTTILRLLAYTYVCFLSLFPKCSVTFIYMIGSIFRFVGSSFSLELIPG